MIDEPEDVADHPDARVLPPGEATKSFGELQRLLGRLLDAGIERGDTIVALGGGVVIDLAGFAAAIVKRGCGFAAVPTSLLAQADAAVGGKTAINMPQGKNLVGAFHRPAAVIADVETLATLPARELRAGYAEIVKYGLIGDAGFFAWCEGHGQALLGGVAAARLHAVEASVRAKSAAVAGDERDTEGRRAMLNFGHSFGHAIEAESGLPHGEAVAIGMALAMRFSAERGLCPPEAVERVEAHLAAIGLPPRARGVPAARLAARMAHDKKSSGGRPRLILVRRIGEAFLDDSAEPDEIEVFLERHA